MPAFKFTHDSLIQLKDLSIYLSVFPPIHPFMFVYVCVSIFKTVHRTLSHIDTKALSFADVRTRKHFVVVVRTRRKEYYACRQLSESKKSEVGGWKERSPWSGRKWNTIDKVITVPASPCRHSLFHSLLAVSEALPGRHQESNASH